MKTYRRYQVKGDDRYFYNTPSFLGALFKWLRRRKRYKHCILETWIIDKKEVKNNEME